MAKKGNKPNRNADISNAVDKTLGKKERYEAKRTEYKDAKAAGTGKAYLKDNPKFADKRAGKIEKKQAAKPDKDGKGGGGKGPMSEVGGRAAGATRREAKISKAADTKALDAIDKFTPGQVDLSGAPELRTMGDTNIDLSKAPALPQVERTVLDRGRFEDAAYNSLTRNFDRDKGRELELQKQELADRGIPYDPGDTTSAYGRALQGINESWDAKKADASNRAFTMADSAALTQANIGKSVFDQGLSARGQGVSELQTQFQNTTAATTLDNQARGQFVNEAIGQHNQPLADATGLAALSKDGDIVSQLMTKYGIDKDAATKMAIADKTNATALGVAGINAEAAKAAKSGGSEDTSPQYNG
jgi:hypothetical protein